jgi:hypothetical protein
LPRPKRHHRQPSKVLIAVHGIRTYAEWNSKLGNLILTNTSYDYKYINYWPFDALDLFLPTPFWRKRKDKVLHLILQAKDRKQDVSIIAHSFGTYLVVKILSECPELTIDNLILCGSIVKPEGLSVQVQRQVKGIIINDCGVKDVWPVIAELFSRSYAASGVRGFGGNVIDRFHSCGHSGFFNADFVRTNWLPIFDGALSTHQLRDKSLVDRVYPWHIRLLMRLASYRLKLAVIAALMGFGFIGLYVFGNICFTSACAVSVHAKRFVNYEQARCLGEQRIYSSFVQDELLFDRFIRVYEARWYFSKDADGRPIDEPPAVYDLTAPGYPIKPEDRSHNREPHFAYPISVSWRRKAFIQWDYRGTAEEPAGVAFSARYPVENLDFQILVPFGMTLGKCDGCEDAIDGVGVNGNGRNGNNLFENIRRNCTLTSDLGRIQCRGIGLPAETKFSYRFVIKGWAAC